ncbi:ATP-binding protein [Rubellimicrobium sp. CFH 75288]|uniref:ATP-binding protein n=1 Tax=Rubellimicrobium sp. CFH 75288 TaxID=2697034 RepID=UPI0014129FD7|nr:ATP-binding protein [Rubellimicrobium sp. CFH 75288]NAZ37876.1 sodium:solute symporter [Rubellimicrobium sp. CFH 75288]
MGFETLVAASLAYVALLFAVAFLAERRQREGRGAWLRSPWVYTLSLSIYCTAWTFYGAVGYAARSGLEFLTIYLGPSLVMVGWWWTLRKLVRIGRTQRVTSIADLISSRFGKSAPLGALVTAIAVAGITPYIALQLQSISLSFAAIADRGENGLVAGDLRLVAFWTAVGLAAFTVLFGTRNLDPSERHHGIVIAIAVEAVVKLVALLAVGAFVVWGLAGGVAETLARIENAPVPMWTGERGRWAGLIFLSAAAFLTLPRMFQVMVVENDDERHLAVAGWAFPLYVFLMSLFVVPIAVVGLERLPAGSNPDLFVLTLPLAEGQEGLSLLSFLGGLSSATSMVIVATIALATMISNHIVAPLWLRARPAEQTAGELRRVVLIARRLSVAGVLALGYLYFRLTGAGTALSAIGLIAFAGVAQILPAMVGGVIWRGATARGAAAGLAAGATLWAWTLFLPSFGVLPASVMAEGAFGLSWLRPRALFGIEGLDPLLHSVMWSLLVNAGLFVLVSLVTFPTPLERLQGESFVNVFDRGPAPRALGRAAAEPEALLVFASRLLGRDAALDLFREEAERQGKSGHLPDTTPVFLARLERELAGSVGAAAAHAMVGGLAKGSEVSVDDLMAVAGEAQQIIEYSARLEQKSAEAERTARALREANAKLTRLAAQKDAFLSRISHELRTPMTAIRSFSAILREEDLRPDERRRFAGIVEAEAQRLTRLLDDLLDLSVLKEGRLSLDRREGYLSDVIDRALAAAGVLPGSGLRVIRDPSSEIVPVVTDLDRLAQVFINIVSNARKYCDAPSPELRIAVRRRAGEVIVDFVDNGRGIPAEERELVFESFTRLGGSWREGPDGAGLGLAICREVMARLGGSIAYLPGQGGAAFRVVLPAGLARAAE